MKRFHWQLFALSTLSFSVSIENFGFNAVVFVKNVLLNCKMSQMYVSHSGVEDIASEYSKEKRLSDIWTFIPLASLKFLFLSL